MSAVWTIEEAQVRLPRLIDDAVAQGPQTIARDGDTLVVVVASHEWDDILKKEADAASSSLQLREIAPMRGHMKNYICG